VTRSPRRLSCAWFPTLNFRRQPTEYSLQLETSERPVSNVKLLLLPALNCLLGAAAPARSATLISVDPYVNLSDTFEWNGVGTTVENQADPTQTLKHPSGWWNMSLTHTKTIVHGNEEYVMDFVGAHNAGPTLEFKPGNSGLVRQRVYDKSLTHGSATDIWKVSIRPDAGNPFQIHWSVSAKHVVPEPATTAVAAAVGLLVFGVARGRSKRN